MRRYLIHMKKGGLVGTASIECCGDLWSNALHVALTRVMKDSAELTGIELIEEPAYSEEYKQRFGINPKFEKREPEPDVHQQILQELKMLNANMETLINRCMVTLIETTRNS